MSAGLIAGVVIGLVVLLVVWLVIRGKKKSKERKARLAAFEHKHGLTGSIRSVRGGPRYTASGTVGGVEVNIESEIVPSARGGMRTITRISGKGTAELGTMVTMRRDVISHDHGLGGALPEQRLGDQAFDDVFRTLGDSAELATSLLTPELRARLVGQGRNVFAFHSIKVAGPEVTVVIGWSLAFGLGEEVAGLVDAALDVVTTMCKPS